jgi:hypothetical protein
MRKRTAKSQDEELNWTENKESSCESNARDSALGRDDDAPDPVGHPKHSLLGANRQHPAPGEHTLYFFAASCVTRSMLGCAAVRPKSSTSIGLSLKRSTPATLAIPAAGPRQ